MSCYGYFRPLVTAKSNYIIIKSISTTGSSGGQSQLVTRTSWFHMVALNEVTEVHQPCDGDHLVQARRHDAFQMHCRYKPGWVTNKPESDFTVILDTSFLNMNVTAVSVRLAYLSSYEHMGQAQVSCLSGCSCSSQQVDAHEVRAKVSVQQAIEFNVTQAPACTIQIHMLSTTSSGGHKFKLIQLTVKGRLG